jgi:hypothetical protein
MEEDLDGKKSWSITLQEFTTKDIYDEASTVQL